MFIHCFSQELQWFQLNAVATHKLLASKMKQIKVDI